MMYHHLVGRSHLVGRRKVTIERSLQAKVMSPQVKMSLQVEMTHQVKMSLQVEMTHQV